MKALGWAAGLVFTAAAASMVCAQGQPTSRPGGGERPGFNAGGERPGMLLERVRDAMGSLGLSDDQKTKVDGILQKARSDFEGMRQELQGLDQRERMQKVGDFVKGVRDDVSKVLTEDQRAKLEKKLEETRNNFRSGPPTSAPSGRPQGERGPLGYFDKLRDNLAKLDLSDEQKAKIKSLKEDLEAKGQSLRQDIQNGSQDAREKVRDLFTETRQKLSEILTPDQQAKLREMMGAPNGGPATRPAANGDEGGGFRRRFEQQQRPSASGDKKMADDKTMMDDKSMADGGGNNGHGGSKPLPKPTITVPDKPANAGAQVGDPAPPFTLKKLDGPQLSLSNMKGRAIVLEFGSWSCPAFRDRAAAMEKLKNEYGARAQFFVIYAREAHAKGEWEVGRNKDLDISVEQPRSLDARTELAKKAQKELKITTPILMDTMGNDTAIAYGAGTNSAVVIGKDGNIVAKQEWCDPSGLKREIEEAGKTVSATKPALR